MIKLIANCGINCEMVVPKAKMVGIQYSEIVIFFIEMGKCW